MFKTVFAKLTLSLLLIFILLSVLTVSITYIATTLYQQEVMQKLNSEVASHIVKETELLLDDRANHPALRKLFHSLMILNPSLEIYLLDHEGTILAFSAPPWKIVRLSVDIEPIKHYLLTLTSFPQRGEDPKNDSRLKVFSAVAVPFKNKPDGYLYVILGGEEYDSIVKRIQGSYILTNSLIVTGIGLFLIFGVGLLLFSRLTRRLKKLSIAVSEYDLNPQHSLEFLNYHKQGDEIDRLTAAFKIMVLKIQNQIDELKTTDHLRRDLIANVSHDLRTPLATLQGYIETLLIKKTELTESQRQNYLEIALKHCKRLNKLVSELFELAKLDAYETVLQPELFNLAELVEDIFQKYTLTCQQKNIKLETQYISTEMYVFADIGLIERVFENLLENSFRFVAEEGIITLTLEEHEQKILIKVNDNGSGIPESELPLIFDRYYQLGNNRHQTEKGNSGLGLAIVKRIIELHNSFVHVTSTPALGTTFSFTLPINNNY